LGCVRHHPSPPPPACATTNTNTNTNTAHAATTSPHRLLAHACWQTEPAKRPTAAKLVTVLTTMLNDMQRRG
jgi:hypothetical protein